MNSDIRRQLEQKGARVHDIFLKRTAMSPVDDLCTLIGFFRLMYILGYTIKPVI